MLKLFWDSLPYKKQILELLVVLILLVIAFAFGRFEAPTKVKTVTETKVETQVQWKDRVVTKVVYKTKYIKVKNTVESVDTTTTTTKKPDGTTTTTTTTHEQLASQTTNTQTSSNNSSTTATQSEDKSKDSDKISSKEVDNSKPSWEFNVMYGYDSQLFNNLTNIQKPEIGGMVQRRILGPIYLGVYGGYDLQDTTAHFGVTAGLQL